MTKQELERRCAEMRAKYAGLRNDVPPTAAVVRSRAVAKRVLPPPCPIVIIRLSVHIRWSERAERGFEMYPSATPTCSISQFPTAWT